MRTVHGSDEMHSELANDIMVKFNNQSKSLGLPTCDFIQAEKAAEMIRSLHGFDAEHDTLDDVKPSTAMLAFTIAASGYSTSMFDPDNIEDWRA